MTESSENRTITMLENGARSYTFAAPLIEGYSLAKNPYKEFRRGIKLTTYTSDSLSLVDVIITSNYAIYYENQELWEAKGNVVIHKHNRKDGDTTVKDLTEVYTQQLFWNAKTKKIYSNVDTKILQADALHIGVGFEADDDLTNIHFRKYSSEVEFEVDEEARSNRSREHQEQQGSGDEQPAADVAKEQQNPVPKKPIMSSDAQRPQSQGTITQPAASTRPVMPTPQIKSGAREPMQGIRPPASSTTLSSQRADEVQRPERVPVRSNVQTEGSEQLMATPQADTQLTATPANSKQQTKTD